MYEFEAELWLYEGEGGWHFITLPVDISNEIRERASGGLRRGFGSVRVRATAGSTAWTTSVFPDTKRGAYLLPVKRDVRRAERVDAGDVVSVTLTLLDL